MAINLAVEIFWYEHKIIFVAKRRKEAAEWNGNKAKLLHPVSSKTG